MKIIGMRIEKYIDKHITGNNCDFEYSDEEFERHIIFGVNSDNSMVKITLWMDEGECYSGWTTASFGRITVEKVHSFDGFTYIPLNQPLYIEDMDENFELTDDGYSNRVFTVSEYGGDNYYPTGFYNVNMKLFKPTVRAKNKRPVWIFVGDSNVGKSYIGNHIVGLSVYETDANSELPNKITEDIIVIGNKNKFSIDEVKNRLFGDCELCIVSFTIQ